MFLPEYVDCYASTVLCPLSINYLIHGSWLQISQPCVATELSTGIWYTCQIASSPPPGYLNGTIYFLGLDPVTQLCERRRISHRTTSSLFMKSNNFSWYKKFGHYSGQKIVLMPNNSKPTCSYGFMILNIVLHKDLIFTSWSEVML